LKANIYTESDIETILSLATWLTVTEEQISFSSWLNKASFLFNRADDQHLYLIWDYTDRKPIANDDNIVLSEPAESQIINVLINDIANGSPITITITTPPTNGTAVVNIDNTITYIHDGSENLTDSFEYQLSNGVCSDMATVNILIETEIEEFELYTTSNFQSELDLITTGKILASPEFDVNGFYAIANNSTITSNGDYWIFHVINNEVMSRYNQNGIIQ